MRFEWTGARGVCVPSPHEHLLHEQPWECVGSGTRRNCYKLGDSGYCVKFYIPRERYDEQHVRPSARRDIEAHRHDPQRNSCSLEVEFYWKHWKLLPTDISDKLLPVVECVYDEKFGYGILETYFTNPDGTAIIPYQFELRRQKDPEARREIYRQARDLLLALIREAAFFYEPGNFHTLLHADGRIETKIVDFEPVSKMFIPLERWWPWYRRQKLRRKAKRYLTSMRTNFGVDIAVETEIG